MSVCLNARVGAHPILSASHHMKKDRAGIPVKHDEDTTASYSLSSPLILIHKLNHPVIPTELTGRTINRELSMEVSWFIGR